MDRNKQKQLIIVLSVMLCAVLALIAVLASMIVQENIPQTVADSDNSDDGAVTVTIRAVGDNLIHSPIYNSCKTEDGFNFDGLYRNISPYMKYADIAAINQETIFVDSVEALSGYPAFGTPVQVGESIVTAGFNVVTHATNHTYDKGEAAILHTLDFWERRENITVLGINKTSGDQQKVTIWQKGGLKIALLNFTYGLNGARLSATKRHLVNILDKSEENVSLLSFAEENADITLVFMHFGTEYAHKPNKGQIEDVEFLCRNGADIIIGAHPHVIQPVTEHISENGNKAVVFYSLGNFISNQKEVSKIMGGMADITVTKKNGVTTVTNYAMHPTIAHRQNGKYSVYMLGDYTNELAEKNTLATELSVDKLQTLFDEVMKIKVN